MSTLAAPAPSCVCTQARQPNPAAVGSSDTWLRQDPNYDCDAASLLSRPQAQTLHFPREGGVYPLVVVRSKHFVIMSIYVLICIAFV